MTFFFLLIQSFSTIKAINFPTNFVMLYFNFDSTENIFWFSLWFLLRSVLFNFQIFGDFPDIILLLISSLIPLWSEISILLHLSKFVLWPRIFSILINVPCAHEKNIYSAILCKVSNKCKYGWLIVLFSSSILLLILLSICSITEKEILKSAI